MDENDERPLKIDCDEIQWKEGKNFTQEKIKRKKKNKNTGEKKVTEKIRRKESFFNVFTSMVAPEDLGEGDEPNEEVVSFVCACVCEFVCFILFHDLN